MKIIAPILFIVFFLIRHLIKPKDGVYVSRNEMESCDNCGTFVTKELIIKKKNKVFCSRNCLKQC